MDRVFRRSEENTAARSDDRARLLMALPKEKTSKPEAGNTLKSHDSRTSPAPGLLRSGRCCARLAVITPRRPARLARSQNAGAQTMPAKDKPL